ncbi:MAG: bifunctional hydroxymethylpyrimidine kinase/phosphomethylpyrimidine kinase [Planctomycetota bacterium]|nr:bifunctional hydroxymethylpyrimidine kinase/phosphomethylpyrimidine kinase [Planctomycetota bacterium]
MTRTALSIAGSDPSGGAGIQADLKTFAAQGVHGAAAITALTAQNTRGVQAVHPVPAGFVADQVSAVLADLDVGAIKIGMLGSSAVTEAVAGVLASRPDVPVVLDPVMVAAGGEPLLDEDAVAALLALVPRAALLTPNVHEAGLLLGKGPAQSLPQLHEQAEALLTLGAGAVLLKGGRVQLGAGAIDVLVSPGAAPVALEHDRVPAVRVHGGGCTLSAAIAARLLLGDPLGAAVSRARAYVRAALVRGLADPPGGGATALLH